MKQSEECKEKSTYKKEDDHDVTMSDNTAVDESHGKLSDQEEKSVD